MDKLGKLVYENPNIAYKFRGKIVVPPLEMVDDVSTCGATSVAMNDLVNSFMSKTKLQLNQSKCAKIHIGSKHDRCPDLKVQGDVMKNSEQEKYLGYQIHQNGKQHATIVDRLFKAYGILANIFALIDDIPLGHRRIEIGFELRQAWFINGTLYKSDIWQQLIQKDKSDIKKVDHILLRSILGAQAKLPRPETELIRKIYEEIKNDPIPGDLSELVKNDFEEINLHINNKLIQQMDVNNYVTIIKKEVREAAFKEFKLLHAGHEKGNKTVHENMEKPQKYLLTNKLTNKHISLLFNLRCQSERTFKNNFHRQYASDLMYPMCKSEIDCQEHLILCTELKKHMKFSQNIPYDHIYGNLEEQISVTILYSSLLEVRERLQ